MSSSSALERTYLSDYRAPDYRIPRIDLQFDLDPALTKVRSRMWLERQTPDATPLTLHGEQLELLTVFINGKPLCDTQLTIEGPLLVIDGLPEHCELCIENTIRPVANKALSGLYLSQGGFFTQCEAEGFRRICYFIDRPDIMSIFTVELRADSKRFPTLLSNGNCIAQSTLADGRHSAKWHDPFPKPSYLFALVAADLSFIQDTFTTISGRTVDLRLYARNDDLSQCHHALDSLKQAMRWDEEQYGREYDLDLYMVVAVSDFNMGAMENKGLNIFNTKYVLASPETATARDYQNVAGVIAHEYFHNWSGNRVTCRDWFQLSLKEGFTVFRDQQFSADSGSSAVKRIQDVNLLRTHQFREDSGPMAHPVRPSSYVEINNFYTLTVYIKGAEVVRMLHTILGAERFRKGCDLYFERHDGEAVTTDDFLRAMQDAAGVDLSQFARWYDQVGTPRISIRGHFDTAKHTYTLELEQRTPALGQTSPVQPLHIPINTALLTHDGQPMKTRRKGFDERAHEHLLEMTESCQAFEFCDVSSKPIVSLLRGFSAPVILDQSVPPGTLGALMSHDDDPYCRWDAAQQLARRAILRVLEDLTKQRQPNVDELFVQAFARVLDHASEDRALQAQVLTLPDEEYLSQDMVLIDPVLLHQAREFVRHALAQQLRDRFLTHYKSMPATAPYERGPDAVGYRALRNICLAYLINLESDDMDELALKQLSTATNMTDGLAALNAVAGSDMQERQSALHCFYQRWKDYPLIVDKWLRAQAMTTRPDALDAVIALIGHDAYDPHNPNKVNALVGGFCFSNPFNFHRADGAGYRFLTDQVTSLDNSNPQLAARLVSALNHWQRYEPLRQQLMKEALERVRKTPQLSRDVAEIVDRALAST